MSNSKNQSKGKTPDYVHRYKKKTSKEKLTEIFGFLKVNCEKGLKILYEFCLKHRKLIMTVFYILAVVMLIPKMKYYIGNCFKSYAEATVPNYLVDYHFYTGTRIFLSSLLSLFTDKITVNGLFYYNTASYIVDFLFFAVCLTIAAHKAIKEENFFLYFTVIFILLCPYSIIMYSRWIGVYETHILIMTILCFIAADKKVIRFICPLLCVAAVFTHYCFALVYFPAIFSICFYYGVKNKNIPSIINAFLCFASTFASSVYCVFFASSTAKMTEEELLAYMTTRFDGELEGLGYIETYYFSDTADILLSNMQGIDIKVFLTQFLFYFLPSLLFFFYFWVRCFRKSDSFFYKVCMLLFIFSGIVGSAVMFFIIESNRWKTAAILSQCLFIFFMLKQKDENLLQIFRDKNRLRNVAAIIVFILYNLYISGRIPANI